MPNLMTVKGVLLVCVGSTGLMRGGRHGPADATGV